jgi:hypothetical protein
LVIPLETMAEEPVKNERKEAPQELPQVEPASGQERVDAVPVFSLEVIPIHPVIRLEVGDDRLDRRPALEPPPDRRVLPPRQVNAHLRKILGRAAVSAINERVADLPPGELLRLLDGPFECVPVVGIAVKRADSDHPVLLRRGDHRDLAAELVFLVGLPLGDALGLRRVHRVDLRGVVALLEKDPLRRGQKVRKPRRRRRTFPLQVPDHAAQKGFKLSRLAHGPLSLTGMGVSAVAHERLLPQELVALPKRDPLPLRRANERPSGLVVQPRVRGKRDRLLLHRRVHDRPGDVGPAQKILPLGRRNRFLEQLLHPFRPHPLAPPNQGRRIQGKVVLEIFEPAEVLPVRVLQKLLHHALVALPVRVLEVVKTDQKPDRQPRPADLLDVEGAELALEDAPVDLVGQFEEGVPGIEDVVEAGAEHVGLVPGVGRLFWRHLSPGNEGLLFNSRQLLHKPSDMKSFFFQYVA